MNKIIIAFVLSVLSFFLMFFLGEGISVYAAFIGLGIYFFIAQYYLSRGNPKALSQDWLIILTLNSVLILTVISALFAEENATAKMQTLIILIITSICSVAGAVLAGWSANKKNDLPNIL